MRSAAHFALSEASILNRTSDCENYFNNYRTILRPKHLSDKLGNCLEESLEKLNSKSGNKR
jgi:hypothetical protein